MTQLFSVESRHSFSFEEGDCGKRGFPLPPTENSGRKNIWEELYSEVL